MPLYEYKCDDCGEVFEVMQKFADEPLSVHEKCGGPVHRLLSTPAFQFKGSGWYVTDYGRGGNGSKQGDKEGKESKPASGDTKSETKSTDSKATESKPAASDKPKGE
jgi:putative FmdB family regulatory protein